MKKTVIVVLIASSLIMANATISFASDWDKAGKVLAVFEGLRVLTGGKADVIGTITGINRGQDREMGRQESDSRWRKERQEPRGRAYGKRNCFREHERVWVPHYVWKEKYVPEHSEHRPGFGEVIIEAHYEKYMVQEGGHWEKVYTCARR